MIAVLLPLLSLAFGPPLEEGDKILVLPGGPKMVRTGGSAVGADRLLFHELSFLRNDPSGGLVFRDGGREVRTRTQDSLASGWLCRTKDSEALRVLRARYVGQPAWCFGPLTAAIELRDAKGRASWWFREASRVRVAAIYCVETPERRFLQRAPIVNGLEVWEMTSPGEDYYLVLFRRAGGFKGSRTSDSAAVGPPYILLRGSWMLDRILSRTPPTSAVRQAIRRGYGRARRDPDRFAIGMTPIETAWSVGWPLIHESRQETLARREWLYGDRYFVYFKNSRATEAGRSLPH